MALLFTDPYEGAPIGSFATEINPDVNKWTGSIASFDGSSSSVSSKSLAVMAGLSSPKAVRIQTTYNNWVTLRYQLGKTVTGNLVVGFLYDVSSTVSGNTLPPAAAIMQLGTGSITANNATQATVLYVLNTGALRLNGVSSAAGLISGGAPAYIEVVRNVATGAVTVFVNDVLVITTTVPAVTAGVNEVIFANTGLTSGSGFTRLDDIYMLDDTGPTFNARLGPVRFTRIPLLASVGTPAFTPQNAASNLAAVNQDNASEAAYNRSPTANGQQDAYSLDTSVLPDGTTVLSVDLRALYRKTSPGPRNLALKATNGATAEKTVVDKIATFGADSLQLLTAPDGTSWDKPKLTATTVAYEVRA